MLSACRDDVKVNKMIKKVNDNSGMPRVYLFTLDSLKSNLKVNVFTKDSVVAEITIQNNSSEPIAFLNKMLPSDTLTESIFHLSVKSITNESINLYPRPIKSKNSYYQGLQFLAPAVIPNIELDSFVSISPNKKMLFEVNLTKLYDLNKYIDCEFSIEFMACYPLIRNGKHVHLKMKDYDFPVPAYFSIGLLDNNRANEYENEVKFKLN
jgi:hypothetical protein